LATSTRAPPQACPIKAYLHSTVGFETEEGVGSLGNFGWSDESHDREIELFGPSQGCPHLNRIASKFEFSKSSFAEMSVQVSCLNLWRSTYTTFKPVEKWVYLPVKRTRVPPHYMLWISTLFCIVL